MIRIICNSLFNKLFWGFMGLYLLNISVDNIDPNDNIIQNNFLFNDQESIVEIVIEQLMGFENAIAENDDLENEDQNKELIVKIDLLAHLAITDLNSHNPTFKKRSSFSHFDVPLISSYLEIDSPPPKS
ncbi:hypothetical protein GYB57_04660 [bacterium]|nr:hypothetical protein [bacterium]